MWISFFRLGVGLQVQKLCVFRCGIIFFIITTDQNWRTEMRRQVGEIHVKKSHQVNNFFDFTKLPLKKMMIWIMLNLRGCRNTLKGWNPFNNDFMVRTSAHFAIPFPPVNFVFMFFVRCLRLFVWHWRTTVSTSTPFEDFPGLFHYEMWSKGVIREFFMICEQCLTPDPTPKKFTQFVSILIKQLGPVNHWRDRKGCPASSSGMVLQLCSNISGSPWLKRKVIRLHSGWALPMVHLLKISPWKRRFRKLESIILRFHGKKFGGDIFFSCAKTEWKKSWLLCISQQIVYPPKN